jgi:hypothetical protein
VVGCHHPKAGPISIMNCHECLKSVIKKLGFLELSSEAKLLTEIFSYWCMNIFRMRTI